MGLRDEKRADQAADDPGYPRQERRTPQDHQHEAPPRLGKHPLGLELPVGVVGVPEPAVPVVGEVCVLVMRSVELAKALYRRERRPHQEEVAEEIVAPARAQVTIVRGVVAEDHQRVLAGADDDHSDHIQGWVPVVRAQRNHRGDDRPLLDGREQRLGRPQHRQFLDLGRGQPFRDGATGVVRVRHDRVRRDVFRRDLRPQEGDDAERIRDSMATQVGPDVGPLEAFRWQLAYTLQTAMAVGRGHHESRSRKASG